MNSSQKRSFRNTAPLSGEPPKKGGILAALRRSPLVGADIDLTRLCEGCQKVDI